MQTFAKTGLTGAALMALMLGMGMPAHADETMCDVKPMSDDAMMSDDSGMDKAMEDDGMMKDDDMATNDMAMDKDMASDDMMDDAMEDDMADDAMMADDMSDDMSDDGMMNDDMAMGAYTVKSGDSLWKIAAVTLCDGDRYPEILAANKDMLMDAMDIHPGQVLHIPGD